MLSSEYAGSQKDQRGEGIKRREPRGTSGVPDSELDPTARPPTVGTGVLRASSSMAVKWRQTTCSARALLGLWAQHAEPGLLSEPTLTCARSYVPGKPTVVGSVPEPSRSQGRCLEEKHRGMQGLPNSVEVCRSDTGSLQPWVAMGWATGWGLLGVSGQASLLQSACWESPRPGQSLTPDIPYLPQASLAIPAQNMSYPQGSQVPPIFWPLSTGWKWVSQGTKHGDWCVGSKHSSLLPHPQPRLRTGPLHPGHRWGKPSPLETVLPHLSLCLSEASHGTWPGPCGCCHLAPSFSPAPIPARPVLWLVRKQEYYT